VGDVEVVSARDAAAVVAAAAAERGRISTVYSVNVD
jgi:hypothetical protein